MENYQSENQEMETPNEPGNSDVSGESVRDVYGQNVTIRQGGMKNVKGDHITVRQGGMLKADAESIELFQGGVGLVRTQTANFTASNAGIVVAGSEVSMDQSATRILVAGGNVTMDQSAAAVLVANNLTTPSASTVFLIAKNVEGNVTTKFGQRESILFAVVSGLVMGVVLSIASLFKKRK
jgi:hypothetical protein